MRLALDASLAFTDALGQVQTTLLNRLDDLSRDLLEERRKITDREEETIRFVKDKAEFSRMAVGQIINDLAALRAIVADGSDDMAQAMARLLAPKLTIAPPDSETVALAQKLAPRPSVAEAAE